MRNPAKHLTSFFFALAALATSAAFVAAPGLAAQDIDDDAFQMDDEAQPDMIVEARTGASMPAGDLGEITDAGFSGGVEVGFPLSSRATFNLEGGVGLLSEVNQDEEFGEGEVNQFFSSGLRLWNYGGAFEYDLADPAQSDWSFILSAGAGATTIDPQGQALPGEVQGTDNETRFSTNGGVAVGYEISETADLFASSEARGIFLQDEDFELDDPDVDDAIGEDWWTFPVQLGLRVSFN